MSNTSITPPNNGSNIAYTTANVIPLGLLDAAVANSVLIEAFVATISLGVSLWLLYNFWSPNKLSLVFSRPSLGIFFPIFQMTIFY